ncbi:hypothetical protein RB2083_1773 [Rhodobacteraceae bacterium HTCC2083]|nr:hypothetical protein RB2083_1773 [Rhodobacteraceae bacterium HTCC2083]
MCLSARAVSITRLAIVRMGFTILSARHMVYAEKAVFGLLNMPEGKV